MMSNPFFLASLNSANNINKFFTIFIFSDFSKFFQRHLSNLYIAIALPLLKSAVL